MSKPILSAASRSHALAAMSDDEGLDVLVIGGGVTGAGVALDAATRGLRTGIVEMQDWASGTSSRSSKLVHGGLRYLYNFDFELVAEALSERGLLLTTTAPHLVKAQPFLWPLKTPVVERSYSAVGVGLYDTLAMAGGVRSGKGAAVPVQKHFSKDGALEVFPDIRHDQLVGAIRYYDARVDDARLVIGLVRTAADYGALAASRTQVTEMLTDERGKVRGVKVVDLETGTEHTIRASRVISATGVWTEHTQDLATTGSPATDGQQTREVATENSGTRLEVLASKGIHLVFDKSRINGNSGLFLRTEKSVLFIIPWQRYWVIGTTDTDWHEARQHPVPNSADIDYILEHANRVLSSNLTRDDIIGTYAGLRPLLQPVGKGEASGGSAKVSREHTVAEVAPGLVAIAGGKLTTYRRMAEDAVDFALGARMTRDLPSVTAQTPLVGASGLSAVTRQFAQRGKELGFDDARIEHLLGRYGAEVDQLVEMIEEIPELAEPLKSAPAYLKAEVMFAITHEGALHLEDILEHRVRLSFETRDRGVSALAEIAEIAEALLGWTPEQTRAEIEAYTRQAEAELAAEEEATDAAAESARLQAKDLLPLR